MTGTLKVVFEGQSHSDEDDESIEFSIEGSGTIQEDFMEKMLEYLEDEDKDYQILYQLKFIFQDGKETDTKPYSAVIGKDTSGKRGGILLKEEGEELQFVASWNVANIQTYIDDLYSNPSKFELVVVTVAESLAPQ